MQYNHMSESEQWKRKLAETLNSFGVECLRIIFDWDADLKRRARQYTAGITLRAVIKRPLVSSVTWSPDGQFLACGLYDGKIVLIDTTMRHHTAKTLESFVDPIRNVKWSPDGKYLAAISDGVIKIWDMETFRQIQKFSEGSDILCIAWSLDGQCLAAGLRDGGVKAWNLHSTLVIQRYLGNTESGHADMVHCVAWSPDGKHIASGSGDALIKIRSLYTDEPAQTLFGHSDTVNCIAWSSNGKHLVSGSRDTSIRLWDAQTGLSERVLEGHSDAVAALAFHGTLLVAQSTGIHPTLYFWNAETGEKLSHIPNADVRIRTVRAALSLINDLNKISLQGERLTLTTAQFLTLQRTLSHNLAHANSVVNEIINSLAPALEAAQRLKLKRDTDLDLPDIIDIHAENNLLITFGEDSDELAIWHIDSNKLISSMQAESIQYTNAKAVLIGETGVGKTGLGTVLSGEVYHETDSTHGRHVWTLNDQIVPSDARRRERHELLLWDMAGQQGYRVVHQLYLDDVAVALIVFDGRRETDPFEGVYYWERALRQARMRQGTAARPQKRFLVAARIDRGGIGVSRERINRLLLELNLDGYFETSARDGRGIAELRAAIEDAVQWGAMLKVSSSELFNDTKRFLIYQKERSNTSVLWSADTLFQAFLQSGIATGVPDELRIQFEICIDRVETTGLIKRLSYGNLVLLQPELLDNYASALVMFVRDEPDGLGNIAEDDILHCRFAMSQDERISDSRVEELLLPAMVEDLIRRDLVVREGVDLIFPAQTTVTYPARPNPPGKTVVFDFKGAVVNTYATLAVRLIRSEIFQKRAIWKDAIEYKARVGGVCGLYFINRGEGEASLALFFDGDAHEETQFIFEEYVATHLSRSAIDVVRRRIFSCPTCGEEINHTAVIKRKEMQFNFIDCNVCNTRIPLLDKEERLTRAPRSLVSEIDETVRVQKERDAMKSQLDGRRALRDYDVFFCYNAEDSHVVQAIAHQLLDQNILPWLFESEQRPGTAWLEELQAAIACCKAGAIFLGDNGLGKWQQDEIEMLITESKKRKNFLVIPAILPQTRHTPQSLGILATKHIIDFRKTVPDPLEALIWGITGKQPDSTL